jgi:hypothetical protein
MEKALLPWTLSNKTKWCNKDNSCACSRTSDTHTNYELKVNDEAKAGFKSHGQ